MPSRIPEHFSPESSWEEKFAYCSMRFRNWKAACFYFPKPTLMPSMNVNFGVAIFRAPDGITMSAVLDRQSPTDEGDLGIRFLNKYQGLYWGVGPNPYDTWALMWWLKEHWLHCPLKRETQNREVALKDSYMYNLFHEGVLLREPEYAAE